MLNSNNMLESYNLKIIIPNFIESITYEKNYIIKPSIYINYYLIIIELKQVSNPIEYKTKSVKIDKTKICKIYIKKTTEKIYKPAMCKNEVQCEGPCSDLYQIINLEQNVNYQIKIENFENKNFIYLLKYCILYFKIVYLY